MSRIKFLLNDNENGLKDLRRSIHIFKGIDEKEELSKAIILQGVNYHEKGKYKDAEKKYKEALRIKKEINDKDGEAACYENMGVLYKRTNDLDKALEMYNRAIKIYKNYNKNIELAELQICISELYFKQNQYNKVIKKLNDSIEKILEKNNKFRSLIVFYEIKSKAFFKSNDSNNADIWLNKGIRLAKRIGSSEGYINLLMIKGFFYYERDLKLKSAKYYNQALEISENYEGMKKTKKIIYFNLGNIYFETGNDKKAIKYLEIAIKLDYNNSIITKESRKIIEKINRRMR